MKRTPVGLMFAVAAALAASASRAPFAQILSTASPSAGGRTSGQYAETVVAAWPDETKKAARALIEKYGEPDAVAPMAIHWNNRGDFKKVAVFRDPIHHELPTPHDDIVENVVSYVVPEDKVGDLVRFNHSVIADLTKATMAAHCESEEMNILALNLADEIVIGKRTVASAKDFMQKTLSQSQAGRTSPYTQKLLFTPAPDGQQIREGSQTPIERRR